MAAFDIKIDDVSNISRKSRLIIHENINFKSVHIACGGEDEEPCCFESFSLFMDGTIHTLEHMGRYCSIGPNVRIGGKGHPLDWLSTHAFQYRNKRIKYLPEVSIPFRDPSAPPVIGNDVWIGAGATILRGVRVGDGAIIAAGALVNRDVKPYEIVGGIPAKHIRYRFDEDTTNRLLQMQWWRYHPKLLFGLQFDNIDKALNVLEKRIKNGLAETLVTKKIVVKKRGVANGW